MAEAPTEGTEHPFARFVNVHLADLLEQLRMDRRFVAGEGAWLWDAAGRRYLDLIANYGAVPFGYNPPEIWDALAGVRDRREPSFVQPSLLDAAGELAQRLIALAPEAARFRYVTFTNSGAEAVEAALKMCRAATGRSRILAARNSFHGKTLGALSATGRPAYQEGFGAPVEGFDFVPYADAGALQRAFEERGSEYAALILEPIQGEGGIVVPPPGYLSAARELATRHGALLIFDEIQTGLGRTGHLFAWEEEGVAPDVMTLAKALGGGLMPIGACVSGEAAYTKHFALKHSSTFAGGALAARAGLAALERLTRDGGALLESVRRRGERLRRGLSPLAARYPHVVREVRGRGLMLGIEFHVPAGAFDGHRPGRLLAVMSEQELLTPVVSSYLLNVEGLRVAPTLNGQSVIRIEPPLIITEAQCDQAIEGVERLVALMAAGRTGSLVRPIVTGLETMAHSHATPAPAEVAWPVSPARPNGALPGPSPDPDEGRFAFLVHPLDLDNYHEFDESLVELEPSGLERLVERFNPMLDPFLVGRTRFVSAAGRRVYGEFVAVPRTTRQILTEPRHEVLDVIRRAVVLARDRGARIVGLGAYTSIVSRGGRMLTDLGVPLTTGNSYTVAAAIEALAEAGRRLGLDVAAARAAVVGAGGSVGRATGLLLSPLVKHLFLVGNPASGRAALVRLERVAQEIQGFEWRGRTAPPSVDVTTRIEEALPRADLVVLATNSADEFVTPEMLAPGVIVLDMSRPPNVSRRVERERPDVLIIDGGVIEVPGRPDFGWSFGYERGLAYACMSETMMLALEHHYVDTSLGSDLTVETIRWMQELAHRHGFRLADLRSFDRPLSPDRWARLRETRAATPAAAR